jgi:hypothetical protein
VSHTQGQTDKEERQQPLKLNGHPAMDLETFDREPSSTSYSSYKLAPLSNKVRVAIVMYVFSHLWDFIRPTKQRTHTQSSI